MWQFLIWKKHALFFIVLSPAASKSEHAKSWSFLTIWITIMYLKSIDTHSYEITLSQKKKYIHWKYDRRVYWLFKFCSKQQQKLHCTIYTLKYFVFLYYFWTVLVFLNFSDKLIDSTYLFLKQIILLSIIHIWGQRLTLTILHQIACGERGIFLIILFGHS